MFDGDSIQTSRFTMLKRANNTISIICAKQPIEILRTDVKNIWVVISTIITDRVIAVIGKSISNTLVITFATDMRSINISTLYSRWIVNSREKLGLATTKCQQRLPNCYFYRCNWYSGCSIDIIPLPYLLQQQNDALILCFSRSELKMNWKKLVQGQVIYHLNRHSELYKNIPWA